jgi:AbrB family looped-hinge helix DNA binding protein
MSVATVTSKGQITIPQDVRERLNITTGTRIEFAELGEGRVEFIPRTGSILDLAGVVKWDGPTMTIEEMDAAIGEHLTEEDRRSRE